ncbi:YwiC-like family protein [Ursidibacter sp. B-7004-1]
MFKEKPIISNQHGALVMAFVPFLYGIFESHFIVQHIFFGLSWLFLYFCSYPFLAIFNRKNNTKYKKWAIIYVVISLLFAIPVFFYKIAILQFSLFILPLVIIQIYYAKKKDERNLINDIAGILTFGIIGMASYYLPTEQYQWWILLHPTLFFIATTLYVKSVARERKNPLYLKLSLFSHLLCVGIYLLFNQYSIAFAYFIALLRAIIVPKKQLNIKQVGILEFGVVFIFIIVLYIS